MEHVILVDTADQMLGTQEKLRAHREGQLHRAFSVFVFNPSGEVLLQQRAWGKYHSGGLWSNTCCSHPRPGESVAVAAARRLREEMGFGCTLHPQFSFVYRAELDGGLVEHEYDHVLTGVAVVTPVPNAAEVAAYCWKPVEAIHDELAVCPERYTCWFQIAFPRLMRHVAAQNLESL
jgi:isopentenyl-diphosphate delta-isomerase